jgi:hypothetical protein
VLVLVVTVSLVIGAQFVGVYYLRKRYEGTYTGIVAGVDFSSKRFFLTIEGHDRIMVFSFDELPKESSRALSQGALVKVKFRSTWEKRQATTIEKLHNR